jgi:small subunit ribosomal protein S17
MTEEIKNLKKSKPIKCVVVSDKMDKSRVGVFERMVQHPQFKKHMRRKTRIMFHDENNDAKLNDTVLIAPSRPRSAKKRFNLLEIIERAK